MSVRRYQLTDRRDDDDRVEQSTGERPLNIIHLLAAVPSLFRHFLQEFILELLRGALFAIK